MAAAPWRELWGDAEHRLAGVADQPAQEVRWLVEEASGLTAAEQRTAGDAVPDERHAAAFASLVDRRAGGEPLQYVLGHWSFRTLDLLVDRRVLIPRPETEVVAGLALDALPPGACRACDLGTGSGAIALSLAAERWSEVEVWATDASADALAVARANLAGLGRRGAAVTMLEGDWFAALPGELRGGFDVVVSNPPYVATADPLPPEVALWEPSPALFAGEDGLDAIRRIVAESPAWLREGGALVLEIGELQGEAVVAMAQQAGFQDVQVHQDLTTRDRAVVAR